MQSSTSLSLRRGQKVSFPEQRGLPGFCSGSALILGGFHPFNLFGEPVLLLGLELVFWMSIAGTVAISIAVVYEPKRIETMIA
jgi:hypothetical protein